MDRLLTSSKHEIEAQRELTAKMRGEVSISKNVQKKMQLKVHELESDNLKATMT